MATTTGTSAFSFTSKPHDYKVHSFRPRAAKGFAVKAGVLDIDKAKSTLPGQNTDLQIVKADVTEGSARLADVDNFGTVNLVEACRMFGVKDSSLLLLNPAYVFLNVLGLTLIAKLQAEQYIRKSGINYTIIRPSGLKNDPPQGNFVMEQEDTLYKGSISRDQVAEVAVEALLHPESHYKVVEVVARTDAPKCSFKELFGSIKQH
ncbi:unnamed protein product [Withania somnifera]